jgi:hypothetical protein
MKGSAHVLHRRKAREKTIPLGEISVGCAKSENIYIGAGKIQGHLAELHVIRRSQKNHAP